jgi:replication factor C small subunit
MKKLSMKIGDLFKILDLQDIEQDKEVSSSELVFIRMPNGDYTKINYFVKKNSSAIMIETATGKKLTAADKHIVIEDNKQVFLKHAKSISCVDGDRIVHDDIISKKSIGNIDLFDVSIDHPHLYCDSYGIIHHNTTVARALCNELKADVLFMNCSKDNSVEDVRTKINSFASSMSLTGNARVFIGDEFDYVSPNGQAALRGLIEQTSNSCRFIFTCNYLHKIIDPLKSSRLDVVDFKIAPKDKPDLAMQFMNRCMMILDSEKIKYDKKTLALLIQKNYPDYRKTLKQLQKSAMIIGEINEEIFYQENVEITDYIKALKAKDYKTARKWIGETFISPEDFFSILFKNITLIVKDDSLAQAILTLNDYQYKHAFAIDPELNLSALTVQLMAQCNMRD